MGTKAFIFSAMGAMALPIFFLFPYAIPVAAETGDNDGAAVSDAVVSKDTMQDTAAVQLINPINYNSLKELVTAIIDVIIQIAVPIAALFLIYSGYLFVSARGSEDDLKKAKSIFLWTLVGIAVLLGAKLLSGVIEGTIDQIRGRV